MSAIAHSNDPQLDCRNCGAPLPQAPLPAFCGHCGQETALHPPTLGEFVHEFVGHYIALEGALWKTLALLVLRPGRLTLEYFEGRRRRYVLPLRLYLTASFLFFLVVKLMPAMPPGDAARVDHAARGGVAAGDDEDDAASRAARVAAVEAAAGASAASRAKAAVARAKSASGTVHSAFPQTSIDDDDFARCLDPGVQCGRIRSAIAHAARRWKDDPQATEHFRSRFNSAVPYALFLMLPSFAAVVMLAYRNRRMLYGEHVVFSLHMHAFWFLAMLALWLLPDAVAGFGVIGILVYGLWALHSVYGGRWRTTVLRAMFISAAYAVLLMAATLVLVGLLFIAG